MARPVSLAGLTVNPRRCRRLTRRPSRFANGSGRGAPAAAAVELIAALVLQRVQAVPCQRASHFLCCFFCPPFFCALRVNPGPRDSTPQERQRTREAATTGAEEGALLAMRAVAHTAMLREGALEERQRLAAERKQQTFNQKVREVQAASRSGSRRPGSRAMAHTCSGRLPAAPVLGPVASTLRCSR
jgi:hypothetical protein